MRNILIIKLRYVGDVVLTTPVIKALRRAFPQANITCLVNPGTEAVLAHNPFLNEVLTVSRNGVVDEIRFLRQVRARHFDGVIDLTDGDRSAFIAFCSGAPVRIGYNHEKRWRGRLYSRCVSIPYGTMHMVEYHAQALRLLNIDDRVDSPEVFIQDQEEEVANQLLAEAGMLRDPWVIMHPSARYWFKAWPPDRFAVLADRLFDRGFRVGLIGTEKDRPIGEAIKRAAISHPISFMGKTTLLELAALMKRSKLFIGNDGGPMHLAAAVGCPIVGLFGPTDPKVWGPRGPRTAVIYKGLDCRACFHPGCFRGEESCMKQISVEEVVNAAVELLLSKKSCAQ